MKKLLLLTLVYLLSSYDICLSNEFELGSDELTRLEEDDSNIFTISHENDFFAGDDLGYTSGVRFSWLSSELKTYDIHKKIMNSIPFVKSNGHKRYNLSISHTMYTPEDLQRRDLIVNDRPYASHASFDLGLINDLGNSYDSFQLSLGLIGPSTKGKEIQKFVHHNISGVDPKGWGNQLKDEVGISLIYEKKIKKIFEVSPLGYNVVISPNYGGSLGNFHTYLTSGLTMKFGYNASTDYEPPLIRPNLPGSDYFSSKEKLSYYFFTGIEGRLVARNIFLDGNTFRSSHHIKKRVFNNGIQIGAAVVYNDVRIAYVHNFMSKEFKGQRKRDEFGAFTISKRF